MARDVFDREGVLKSLSGDAQLLGELVSIYVASLEGRVAAIARALERSDGADFAEVAHVAHNLLGSSRTVGALTVGATAKALDTAARADDEAVAREMFTQLKKDIAEFVKAKDPAF